MIVYKEIIKRIVVNSPPTLEVIRKVSKLDFVKMYWKCFFYSRNYDKCIFCGK